MRFAHAADEDIREVVMDDVTAKPFETRIGILCNAILTRPGDKRYEEALLRIREIEASFRRDFEALPVGKGMFRDERPEESPIHLLGYNTKNIGPNDERRRIMIDYFMQASMLPPIQSQSFMREWGLEPGPVRFAKFERYLLRLMQLMKNQPENVGSCARWQRDLDYIRANWPEGRRA